MQKMLNNYMMIKPLLKFEAEGQFYFIQIFKRRKDNPGMKVDMKVIKNYAVYSHADFEDKFPEILRLCEAENARAYIRLNRRDDRKVALNLLKKIATMISNDQYNMRNAYWSSVGESCTESDKTWIIDIDWADTEGVDLEKAQRMIMELQTEAKREPLAIRIPTRNGFHLITRPFNLAKLREAGFRFDIHKDNPTILYIA